MEIVTSQQKASTSSPRIVVMAVVTIAKRMPAPITPPNENARPIAPTMPVLAIVFAHVLEMHTL